MIDSNIILKGVENSPASVVVTDASGIIIYVNKKTVDLTGYSDRELLGSSPSLLKSGNHDKSFYDDLWNTISAGKEWTGNFINKKKNGELYWERAVISPIFKGNTTEIQSYIAIKEDITERVKIQENLTLSNMNKDKLFSIISHDLRAPFQGIIGYINILKEEYDDLSVTEVKSMIDNLHASTKSVFELLDNLLYWSRLQRNIIKFNPVPINLYELCVDVKKMSDSSAKAKKIKLINGVDLDIVIDADENMLYSIYHNLISNSLKFTNTNGRITMFSEKTDHNSVIIGVRDNGVGITPDNIKKILQSDEHFSIKGTKKEVGSGLGLILVKEFIEYHHSKLNIISEIDKGSEFSFELNLF